jgi:hypothetical protein
MSSLIFPACGSAGGYLLIANERSGKDTLVLHAQTINPMLHIVSGREIDWRMLLRAQCGGDSGRSSGGECNTALQY